MIPFHFVRENRLGIIEKASMCHGTLNIVVSGYHKACYSWGANTAEEHLENIKQLEELRIKGRLNEDCI